MATGSAQTNISAPVATVIAAAFVLIGGVIGAYLESRTSVNVERNKIRSQINMQMRKMQHEIQISNKKFESRLIFEAVKTYNIDQAKQNMNFLVDTGLIGEKFRIKKNKNFIFFPKTQNNSPRIQISEHYTLAELVISQTASRLGIDNFPKRFEIIENLRLLAKNILEPVWKKFGRFSPNSVYRSIAVDRALNGDGLHTTGQAADFEVPGHSNLKVACWIKDNLDYDQLILEFYEEGQPNSGWVHVTYKKNGNRKLEHTRSSNGKKVGLPGNCKK